MKIPIAVALGLLAALAPPVAAPSLRAASAQRPAPGNGNGAAHPAHDAPALAIAPFESLRRDPRYDWLGEGLAELAVEHLSGVRGSDGEQIHAPVFPREEWLAALERMGLPASARFSRATLLKIAVEMDADGLVFGRYSTDGTALTISARVLHISPASLSAEITQSGPLGDVLELQARLVWQLRNLLAPPSAHRACCPAPGKGRFPSRMDAFEQYVRGATAADEPARIRLLREAARLDPQWELPAFALGKAYLARRDCTNALPWFERVEGEDSWRAAESAFYAGLCLLQQGQASRAQRVLTARSDATPLPEQLNNLGVALLRQGLWLDAAETLERAVALEPDIAEAWFNLGQAKYWHGASLPGWRGDSGIRALREALRQEPRDLEVRAWLAVALDRAGRPSEAAVVREQAPGALPSVPAGSPVSPTRPAKGRGAAAENAGTPAAPYTRLGRMKTALDPHWRTRGRHSDADGERR